MRGILTDRAIWATHFQFTNDTTELVEGERIVAEETAAAANETSDEHVKHVLDGIAARQRRGWNASAITRVHIASFCEDGDCLSQWRAKYGENGAGYSLGLANLSPLIQPGPDGESDLSLMLARCCYEETELRRRVRAQIELSAKVIVAHCKTYWEDCDALETHGQIATAIALVKLAVRFKHPAFVSEREWRIVATMPHGRTLTSTGDELIKHRAGPRGQIPYVAVPLTTQTTLDLETVRLGPVRAEERRAPIVDLLRALGYNSPERSVSVSKIPFRP